MTWEHLRVKATVHSEPTSYMVFLRGDRLQSSAWGANPLEYQAILCEVCEPWREVRGGDQSLRRSYDCISDHFLLCELTPWAILTFFSSFCQHSIAFIFFFHSPNNVFRKLLKFVLNETHLKNSFKWNKVLCTCCWEWLKLFIFLNLIHSFQL